MAMLAEPRKRQKWSLNPRGAIWANDDNKLCQKLMEKMGWSKGKGLGRKEQGMREHISLKFKDNSKGLGYKGNDDQWIKHYEGFEDVLSALNSEHNSAANSKSGSACNSSTNSDEEIDQKKKMSLEARSKVSKARVHYHKFTRGKDLSRYKEDDIACILGSKRAKKLAEAKTGEESTTEGEEIGHPDNLNGVMTVQGCTIQDYFAQKMDAFRKKSEKRAQELETDNLTREAEEPGESRERHGFGFDSGIEDEENATTATVNNDERSTQGSTKKKKRQSEEVDKKKKKKKAYQLDDVRVEERIEDGEKIEKNNEVEESKEVDRKKKRKQAEDKEDQLNDEVGENYKSQDILSAEYSTKSKKCKKKKKNMIDSNEGNDLIDSSLTTLEDINESKMKKKKKRAESLTEVIYQNVKDDDSVVEGIDQYANQEKKKKRNRNKEHLEYADEKTDIPGNQKKKIKSRKDKHLDGHTIEGTDAEGILSDMQLEKKKKRKKDKKQKNE